MDKMKSMYLNVDEIHYIINETENKILRPAFSASEFNPFYNDSKWWYNGKAYNSVADIINDPNNNKLKKNKYNPKDIIWIKEGWLQSPNGQITYKADYPNSDKKWNTPAKMSMDKARIFIRIKDVKINRIQDVKLSGDETTFANIWNKNLKPRQVDSYRWGNNPWVWEYDFERIEVNWLK